MNLNTTFSVIKEEVFESSSPYSFLGVISVFLNEDIRGRGNFYRFIFTLVFLIITVTYLYNLPWPVYFNVLDLTVEGVRDPLPTSFMWRMNEKGKEKTTDWTSFVSWKTECLGVVDRGEILYTHLMAPPSGNPFTERKNEKEEGKEEL